MLMQFRVSPKSLENFSAEEWQARVDLAACWVLDGIHGAELRMPDGGAFDLARAEQAAREAGALPVATVPRFVW